MTKSILIATFASMLLSSAAIAADAIDEVPSAPAAVNTPAAFSWAGGYAGAMGGYGWMKGEFPAGDFTFKGGRIGGFGGWNFDIGNNIILGAEADLNYDWNKKTIDTESFATGISGSARARAGYAVDKALFFVAGGWTAAQAKYKDSDGNVDINKTFNGWTVGGGVDYAITKTVFARAEYRYNDLGSKTVNEAKPKLTQNVINVGVGVKF